MAQGIMDIFLEYINNIGYRAEAFVISDSEDLNRFSEKEIPFDQKECCCILCMTEDKQVDVQGYVKRAGMMVFPQKGYDYNRLINYLKETNILYKKGYLEKREE